LGVFSGIDGQRLFSVHGLGRVRDLNFSPDGQRIAAAGGDAARVWDSTSGQALFLLRTEIPSVLREVIGTKQVIFSADGRWIAVHLSDGTVSLSNAADGRQLAVLRHSDPGEIADVQRTVFSPDGKRAITAVRLDRTARIWNVASGELLFMAGHGGPVTDGAFSSDGRRVVTSSEDRKARVWDTTTGRLLTTIEVGWAERVAFSPDGAVIVTTSLGRVKAWDPATGASTARCPLRARC
jgi:WD40 repeat protein